MTKEEKMRGDFQDLITAFPSAMIDEAKSLHRYAMELKRNESESSQSDRFLFMGKSRAVCILLSLATEIALKAWQVWEGKKEPDRTHDLLELFKSLKPDTQKMLEARMRKLSPYKARFETKYPLPDDLYSHKDAFEPLRDVLCFHKDAFELWRYSYEIIIRGGASFETGDMDRALTVIVDAYCELLYREFGKPVALKPFGNRGEV